MSDKSHVLVAGAGVVGIACGISLIKRGFRVTLVDPAEPGTMTSSGNAGGFAYTEVMPMAAPGIAWRVPSWLLDADGPLSVRWRHLPSMLPWLCRFHRVSGRSEVERISIALRAILRASEGDTQELLSASRLTDLFTAHGAITVYHSEKSRAKDALEWEIKRARGIVAEQLDVQQLKDMEPELSNVACGVYTPQWCNTIDPFVLTSKLARYFVALGGVVRKDAVADFVLNNEAVTAAVVENGDSITFDKLVVAAGVWSKALSQRLGDHVLLESERGYNTTFLDPGIELKRQIIFADRKFVVSKIGSGLRVGGAAEFAGISAPPNYKRCEKLVQIAKRYLPDLNTRNGTQWMGHRPSTPDSLPVISQSTKHSNVFYAFGHGHLGLTMAATTGKVISSLVSEETPEIHCKPFHIDRFENLIL